MSSGNLHQDRLQEELDAAVQENAPSGKLEDAEIQRLVQLSNDASYQRSDRVRALERVKGNGKSTESQGKGGH